MLVLVCGTDAKEYARNAGLWPLSTLGPPRHFPDGGLLQMPLDSINSYFGSKIAFYFAWAENFNLWSLILGLVGVLCSLGSLMGLAGYAEAAYTVFLVGSITFFVENWRYKNVGLAFKWAVDHENITEKPLPKYLHAYQAGVWRGAENGGSGAHMYKARGFFTESDQFVPDPTATEELVMRPTDRRRAKALAWLLILPLSVMMVIGNFAILTFQMLSNNATRQNQAHADTLTCMIG